MYFTQEQINNLEKSWKLVSEPGGRAKSTIHPLLLKANIDRFYRLQLYLNLNLKISFCTQGGGLTEANTPGTGIRQSDSPQKLLYIHLCIIWASVIELMFFCKEQASAHVCGSSLRSKPQAVNDAATEILLPDYWHDSAAAQCSDWLISDRIPSLERRAGWKNGVGGLSCCLFSLDVEKHSVPSPRLCFPGVWCLVMVAWAL